VGRGVLADVARWRDAQGRPIRYGEPDAVTAAELMACLADQGTEVAEGDVLLVRFGWVGWYEAQAHDVRDRLGDRSTLVAVGFEAGEDLARTLWNLRVAAVGTDTAGFEAWPLSHGLSPAEVEAYRTEQVRLHEIFAHTVLLPMLGLPLGELFALDALAADCDADGHHEFMFTSAPLNLPNGVASPPNALAIK
jgi:kynurenine formamidase